MLKVRCIICIEAAYDKALIELVPPALPDEDALLDSIPTIQSSIIAKSKEEGIKLIMNEMIRHLEMAHPQELPRLAALGALFNGFNIMNRFQTRNPDSSFEEEKEKARDLLCEEVMKYAPEDEEEDEEDLMPEEEEETIEELGKILTENLTPENKHDLLRDRNLIKEKEQNQDAKEYCGSLLEGKR